MFNPEKSRQTIRMRNFNYKSTVNYFVTLCTNERLCLFGKIINGVLHLNDAGHMVHKTIANINNHHFEVIVKDFIVMPNHIHAIIFINYEVGPGVLLGNVVKNFKTYTTCKYINGIDNMGWRQFNNRLWQRGYYESVIRDQRYIINIKRYIKNNPANWNNDKFSNTVNKADP